jgi:hypothetical protein
MARKPTLPGWAGRPATDGAKRASPRGASSETIPGPLDPAFRASFNRFSHFRRPHERQERQKRGERAAAAGTKARAAAIEGERRRMMKRALVRWKRGRGVQTGSAISRNRSSLLIALLRRRSDTQA